MPAMPTGRERRSFLDRSAAAQEGRYLSCGRSRRGGPSLKSLAGRPRSVGLNASGEPVEYMLDMVSGRAALGLLGIESVCAATLVTQLDELVERPIVEGHAGAPWLLAVRTVLWALGCGQLTTRVPCMNWWMVQM